VILIDCPPSLKLLTSNGMATARHIIVPVESGSQYGLDGADDLLKHIEKIKRINPRVRLLGALLLKHDERQTVCNLLESTALKTFGVRAVPGATAGIRCSSIAQDHLAHLAKRTRTPTPRGVDP
jgi:cellulose biosynthesis protein BcsQ